MPKMKKIPTKGSAQWLRMKDKQILKANNRAANRNAFLDKMNDRKALNVKRDINRSNEYYRTKRSKSRATKLSAAAASIMESSERTERVQAQEETKRQQAVVQYANLINGNQSESGGSSNQKDNAPGVVNWN